MQDTICAVATAAGTSGIAIIRISGENALSVLTKVFSGKITEPRKMVFGMLKRGEETVDHVLAVYFKAPHSFTGEDVCEIQCHGGAYPVKFAMQAVTEAGARPAEPGEFTKRAFLNGKLDLTQAEAIMDYIGAVSAAGAKISSRQLQGALKIKIEAMQDRLTDVIAELEAGIEYPEEDLELDIAQETVPKLEELQKKIETLIDTFDQGKKAKEGIRVAFCGKPNVGKSSLLNAIIGEERAIVTNIPGTTRDVISESYQLHSVPLVFMDTAGIRKTNDTVERIGVDRSRAAVFESDIVLLVIDASQPVSEEDLEIFKLVNAEKCIVVLNKTDIVKNAEFYKIFEKCMIVETSAKTGEGIDILLETIYDKTVSDKALLDGVVINNERHLYALEEAKRAICDAIQGFSVGIDLDCVSIDIKNAWNALGKITGTTVTEEIVDRIFEKFCLGK